MGVLIFGDLPFYVARDSVDVWRNKELFSVLSNGEMYEQSGVPPDYFSDDGQLWGTPVYRWRKHKASKYRWWRRRFRRQWEQFDLLRLDHFRALNSYWSVPAKENTAKKGTWMPSPGLELLHILQRDYGEKIPLVAEDLGEITPAVIELRDYFRLPGMKILQFAFDGDFNNPYLPENINGSKSIVYTGTHDNPTTNGWWNEIEDNVRQRVLDRSKDRIESASKSLIEMGLSTDSCLFIAPIQDILGLGNEARFNTPGTIGNNWIWRLESFDKNFNNSLKAYGGLSQSLGRSFDKSLLIENL